MKKIYTIIAIAVSCLVLTTCKKDKEPVPPVFEFNEVEAFDNSAEISGWYEYEGELKNLTLIYGKDSQLVDAENKDVDVEGKNFRVTVDDLEAETKYYYSIECKTTYSSMRTKTESFMITKSVSLAMVTTNEVTDITTNSATCGGNVTDDGGATVTARGVCWSTSQNPTINDNKTTDGNGTGNFTSILSNLAPQITYYVRAYATYEKGTAYGEEKSFTTLEENTDINGHEYVNLGLPSGLKWATCNVGATSPEEYGDYFAWGETTKKTEYTEENSLTLGLSDYQLQSLGYIDSEGNLTAQYDAARANWGGDWRMPTRAEIKELINNCTWTWTTQSGVNGCKVEGPNGNSIFLPAAGYSLWSQSYNDGYNGDYWSSTPHDDSYFAYYFSFGNGIESVYDHLRNLGRSVRPVIE